MTTPHSLSQIHAVKHSLRMIADSRQNGLNVREPGARGPNTVVAPRLDSTSGFNAISSAI